MRRRGANTGWRATTFRGGQGSAAVSRPGPEEVRAWYGLPGEIVIEGDHWHLVKLGPVPLPHPPLVNLLIRRGLPRRARLALSFWHELGHIQTLPLAVGHALWLWRRMARGPTGLATRAVRVAASLVAQEAAWELAAETYAMARTGRAYWRLYRSRSGVWLAGFSCVMVGLVALGTVIGGRKGRR
jgi:hypothetical protein